MGPLKSGFKRHFDALTLDNGQEKEAEELPDELRVAEDSDESEAESDAPDGDSSSGNDTELSFEDEEDEEESEEDSEVEPEPEGEEVSEKNDDKVQNSSEVLEKAGEEEVDEYQEDTSDEEDIRNTVGNIPMHWYDEYKHIGYDWDAKKLVKPAKGDQLDDFLKRMEDPDFWKTVRDPQTGQNVVLSDEDIDLIKRIAQQKVPDAQFDEFQPWIDWFTSEVEKMPIRNIPAHKRSFLPSKSEKKKISKYVHALKMGWMKTKEELEKEAAQKRSGPKFYMLWESDTTKESMRRIHDHVSAPKRPLPGHAESYNPPPEYLFDKKEMREWKRLEKEPHKRKLHFVPQKYRTLREVPAYPRYTHERFLRCLDLYLCPRAHRMKLTIEPEYLIPKLPSPRDLQPFPTQETLIYSGHSDIVRTISVEPRGEFLVTGSDDTSIKIWEISTARCIKTIQTKDIVRSVAWCPNSKISIIAVASGQRLLLINPETGDKLIVAKTDELLADSPESDLLDPERLKAAVQWSEPDGFEHKTGFRIVINHFKQVKQVTWHGRGDYLASVMPDGAHRSVIIHQLSKRRSQFPFSKTKGLVECVLFHPIKPQLFVATQKSIRVYDLAKQELMKKLQSNSNWISDMAIHPKGDNLIVSTFDKKLLWFDLDLSTKPYQTMRLHREAVRGVAFHRKYPLFASGSDDVSVIVSHGMVYNDLLQNPLIVPLKKLETHEKVNDFGVFSVIWHPSQPWVFSTGGDKTIRLYT
uniref:Ribosome biogenesis protein BOP1 homolog n=1 Tax=Phlebotomus papatasi TaxID=29031 RepID=A0A1B0DLR0_PHLPP